MDEGLDQQKSLQFLLKCAQDAASANAVLLTAIGERLGLFGAMASTGPCTSATLAGAASVDERYAREWLAAMTACGVVEHSDGTFVLPPEHAALLSGSGGGPGFARMFDWLTEMHSVAPLVVDAFRSGGGVPQSAYPSSFWAASERFGAATDRVIVDQCVPALPALRDALERGIDVADIGCGNGRKLAALARAYPSSRFVGYDIFEDNVRRAGAHADGLDGTLRFEARDASSGLPETYDLITVLDVVHDAADPLGVLRAARSALRPGGTCLCLEIRCSERLDDNVGPLGALLYGVSILYCMTTSLASGGAGLGTMGLPESRLRELAVKAGFADVRALPVENPINVVYELVA